MQKNNLPKLLGYYPSIIPIFLSLSTIHKYNIFISHTIFQGTVSISLYIFVYFSGYQPRPVNQWYGSFVVFFLYLYLPSHFVNLFTFVHQTTSHFDVFTAPIIFRFFLFSKKTTKSVF